MSSKQCQNLIDVDAAPQASYPQYSRTRFLDWQYLSEVVSTIKIHGKILSICAAYQIWELIMGDARACTYLSGVPLKQTHQGIPASFPSVKALNCWTSPNIKQYEGYTTDFGVGVNLNFN
ncbi:Glycosyl hydrolases family 25 protein [Oxytricha trifallax]|uniref:Glycosyl hydrolases family 25 protein n=1 Tax=Oxytricha trifallax TaxID=1172189 RepID=A0A073HX81_9SPIT|nr:Glycosyl hydrolases family 25 protein [Oxytricha trifallax]